MKQLCLLLVFAIFIFPLSHAQNNKSKTLEDYVKSAPFKMPAITVRTFPSKSFSIKGFGAVAEGQTLNTAAFAKAKEACSKAGGGNVVGLSGTWLTGPIQMKCYINLHVERGGLILFTTYLTQYHIIKASSTSSIFTPAFPIYDYELKNIAITGEGIIDGSGEAWRPVKKSKLTA